MNVILCVCDSVEMASVDGMGLCPYRVCTLSSVCCTLHRNISAGKIQAQCLRRSQHERSSSADPQGGQMYLVKCTVYSTVAVQ
jgi:hypothetical protein